MIINFVRSMEEHCMEVVWKLNEKFCYNIENFARKREKFEKNMHKRGIDAHGEAVNKAKHPKLTFKCYY